MICKHVNVNEVTVYAKLFSRITESSLMEESIPSRYAFVMLLAIADPKGYIIGTDVAIARRINMPVDQFKEAIQPLMNPDPNSNSSEEEGRRMVPSDGERGYRMVNYVSYRDAKDADSRREYMREYMRKRREEKGSCEHAVASVNIGKHRSTQASASASVSSSPSADEKPTITAKEIYDAYPRKVGRPKAMDAIKRALGKVPPAELLAMTQAYADSRKGQDQQFTPHPSTWFAQERYNDHPSTWGVAAPLATTPQPHPELLSYNASLPEPTETPLERGLRIRKEAAEKQAQGSYIED